MTLAVIILVTIASSDPRFCEVLLSISIFNDSVTWTHDLGDIFVIINPLFDPVIFSFRIDMLRKELAKIFCKYKLKPTIAPETIVHSTTTRANITEPR